jgi:hypothetical protein
MACRSAPGFPKLREQLEIMTASTRPGPETVQQSVRQYLIEGPELFAVHRCHSRALRGHDESEKFMACRSAAGFPELREQLEMHDASIRPGPGFSTSCRQPVQQSVRQYLIEGPELFAVHRCHSRAPRGHDERSA